MRTASYEESVFEYRSLEDIYREVQHIYREFPHPWVVGYSGGKDSTATLQLIWYALSEIPPEQRDKRVYVISSDTLVETPVIVDHVATAIDRINKHATLEEMPFEAHLLRPALKDTFWVNLIGRGYPAPNSLFRWCTERLKINASNRFILSKVEEHGEVILALGMRSGESSKRDQVIKKHRFTGHPLSRHGQLPGAWVYMPIEDFSVDDVWNYLLNVASPWEGDNRRLRALYQSANDGECPMVVDNTTPPCGNSRFGCWVCTVVDRDTSMEAMIDAGDEWMIPLLEFRDWLASTQDPKVKPEQREYKGRNGQVRIANKRLLWRTYTLGFSKKMLKRLLETQSRVQAFDPELELISERELREIRRLWLTERQDWEDSLPGIFSEVTGRTMDWELSDVSRPGKVELDLLTRVMEKYDIPVKLPQKLLDAEWQCYGMRRRASIHKTIERIIDEDWRTLEQVQEEVDRHRQRANATAEDQ
jgi:DNA sulfur modification protein DndC